MRAPHRRQRLLDGSAVRHVVVYYPMATAQWQGAADHRACRWSSSIAEVSVLLRTTGGTTSRRTRRAAISIGAFIGLPRPGVFAL